VEERPFQGRVGKEMASNAALKRRSSTKRPSAERLRRSGPRHHALCIRGASQPETLFRD
jgi:hypothetical protein